VLFYPDFLGGGNILNWVFVKQVSLYVHCLALVNVVIDCQVS
jgi:hypothetical protein